MHAMHGHMIKQKMDIDRAYNFLRYAVLEIQIPIEENKRKNFINMMGILNL
jgi:hypothetical protein